VTTLHCPVCPSGPELRVVDAQLLRLPFRRCDVCLGLLADPSTVVLAGSYYQSSHYIMSEGHGRHHCRNCEALFDQMRERCRVCLKPQSLCCVRCLMPMEMLEIAGVALDVCRTCRLVWFDRGELGLLLRRHAGALQQGLTHRPRAGLASQVGRSVLHHPDALSGGFELARVGVEVTGHVVTEGGASAVVEVATSAGEAAVELSAGALEVLAGILSDVF
jgi:hypothetical protein